ncbi:MAG: electron transfer flavoprotein-ubiquinone oxidoreductase [Actinomycetota bacterium]|nr:electron transfer flavoprotein-ubiquinone oxidoreductase [Actinomycetota bacterium]
MNGGPSPFRLRERRRPGDVAPSAFPPPVEPAREFVGAPTDPPEERIEVGVAVVGGGVAGLACAIHLLQLAGRDPALAERLGDVPVAVLEKGAFPGAHGLSGAVLDPVSLRDLVPEGGWPHFGAVPGDAVHLLLDERRSVRLRPVPPPFRNRGNVVVSVAELTRWLAERAEEAGAYLLPETVGAKLLVRDGDVLGVRSGDRGRGRDGKPLATFEPGSDVVARATVLAEGCWGHLTGAAIEALDLGRGADPQVWALGVKEVWEVERPLDRVVHTVGWPLRPQARFREFGGSWLYPMRRDGEPHRVSLGHVVGLDYADPGLSPHDLLQELKLHPLVREVLRGGRRVAWGAKAIPEGGFWALPRLHAPGLVLCGDAAGMVNVPKLKGLHYAIRSGMLAAQTLARQLPAGSRDLSDYERAVRGSEIGRDLYASRNTKQAFSRGLVVGGAIAGAMVLTGGRFPGGHWRTHRDADAPLLAGGRTAGGARPDGALTFDKLSSVYLTGNEGRDDAPDHLRVQRAVPRELARAWAALCPAAVYEVPEETRPDGRVDLAVHPANCVQCGAITAKGGRLTPPEGGAGPRYRLL